MPAEEQNQGERVVLVAKVVHMIFSGGDDGFTVLAVEDVEDGDRASAVGNMGAVAEDDTLRMVGSWQRHPRYGRQFRVESFQKVLPQTARGVEAYLSRVDAVGPVTAKRLVKHLGTGALEIIAAEPARVREVPGIGKKRAKAVMKALEADVAQRETLIFLQSHGIALGTAQRIMHRYGDSTVEKVRSDPFNLADEVGGIGFVTADRIARSLGVEPLHAGRLRAGVLYVVRKATDEGHLYLPSEVLVDEAARVLEVSPPHVEHAAAELVEEGCLCPVPGREDWLGPLEHVVLEQDIAGRLLALAVRPSSPPPSEAEITFAEKSLAHPLDKEQRSAVAVAVQHSVAVVTGGPGTGKTTLLRGALALLQRRGLSVALGAPTGRAARRLTETTGSEAKTLHRLLEYSPAEGRFMRDINNPLNVDAVIVDEVSMVDVPLMAALCRALPDEGRLVLVGDFNQLPSVGPGLVLHDIIASEQVPVVRLRWVYRQAGGSLIIENAHRVLNGERPRGLEARDELTDFYVVHLDEPEAILAAIEATVCRRIPARFNLDPLTDVQVLVPMHRGLLGAENLNLRFQELLNGDGKKLPGQKVMRVGDRVIQTKNDWELDVANGDVGFVLGPGTEEGELRVRFDDRTVVFPSDRVDALRLAYALSIHKSQGSEYPAVVIPLHTQHFMMLRRNLLYTAVTRGRKLVVLVGSKKAIAMAVRRDDAIRRYTNLGAMLRRQELA
jgi:exodeoxyribonuclease V alpha subunit